MSSSHYKFNRPDFRLVGRIGQGQPYLELSGAFPDATAEEQYSGSIDVLNAIGAFTVEMTAGSLPPGAVVFADTTAGKVFVEWPEYAAESSSPSVRDVATTNYDFSQGDTGWLLGTGWAVKTDGTSSSGPNTAQYGNAGASIIWSASEFPVEAGDEVRFGARINPSENGNSSSGQSTVSFFKSNGEWISSKWNPGGAAGNSYQWDYVYAVAPAESAKYRVGVIGNKRRASTNPVRVDVVDHKLSYTSTTPEQGTDEGGVWNFTLKATDSAGRWAAGNYTITVVSELAPSWQWDTAVGATPFAPFSATYSSVLGVLVNNQTSASPSRIALDGTVSTQTITGAPSGEFAVFYIGSGDGIGVSQNGRVYSVTNAVPPVATGPIVSPSDLLFAGTIGALVGGVKNIFGIGYSDGKVYRYNGSSWSAALGAAASPFAVAFLYFDEARQWLISNTNGSANFLISTDLGVSFTAVPITGTFIGLVPVSSGWMLVESVGGVYTTRVTADGSTWSAAVNTGVPVAPGLRAYSNLTGTVQYVSGGYTEDGGNTMTASGIWTGDTLSNNGWPFQINHVALGKAVRTYGSGRIQLGSPLLP